MIVLDTNVLSAMIRPLPDARVLSWLDGIPREQLWLSSVTVFEVRVGIGLLPAGSRRAQLDRLFDRALNVSFQGRVLPFDTVAANEAAVLFARRQLSGRSIDYRDTQIAGIVLARKAQLATRNVKHFSDLGDIVVNPWAD